MYQEICENNVAAGTPNIYTLVTHTRIIRSP